MSIACKMRCIEFNTARRPGTHRARENGICNRLNSKNRGTMIVNADKTSSGSVIRHIARRIREGNLSAVDVTKVYLKQIEQSNSIINSLVAIDPDFAIQQAQTIDKELANGIDRGLLAGIPIAIKDNICTIDFTTTAGSNSLREHKPPYDADVVRALKNAGAILIGKANMDEFGMGSTSESSQLGATRNPWDVSCVPGGSSGGSAAAVAAQHCVAAVGTDTGGSVRQPASHCGLVGLKPTYGRLTRGGLLAYASSFDCIGTLTSSVEDCAVMIQALTSQHNCSDLTRIVPDTKTLSYVDDSDFILKKKPLEGYKFGVVRQATESGVSDGVLDSFWESIHLIRELGAHVETISCASFAHGLPAYYILALSEASSNLARYDGIQEGSSIRSGELASFYSGNRSELLGEEVKRRILMGTYTLSAGYADAYYERALKVRTLVRNELRSKLDQYDGLLTPAASSVAPKLNSKLRDPLEMYVADIMTVNVNLSGLPAIVVRGKQAPGTDSISLPVGLQLIGKAFGEAELLRIASIFERASYQHLGVQSFPKDFLLD